MNTAFMPVTLDLLDSYMTYFWATSCRSADYTFTNLWGWADHYGLELSFRDDLCWIRQTRPFVQFWAPVGNWGCADWDGEMNECPVHSVRYAGLPTTGQHFLPVFI